MLRKEILIFSERCCGCLLCELICSATNKNAFSPEEAFISVRPDPRGAYFTVQRKEGCKGCGRCVEVCPTGALVFEEAA
ncbi:MAG: hypothetical protein DRG36_01010 [Deltaproteobacteria bacterium]|nr:MAG: hypothetical protein DRG36_01010 [Deltaproteobacteria bacterium]